MSESPPASGSVVAGANGASERTSLLAALSFVDGVPRGWSVWDLSAWFDEHFVGPGQLTTTPTSVFETGVGIVAIDARSHRAGAAAGAGAPERLGELLVTARRRVIDALTCFTRTPRDDRFLHAAIYARRVERRAIGKRIEWVSQVQVEGTNLSDLVLALFAADILNHREFYESQLAVCELCGRIAFSATMVERSRCALHPPANGSGSGYLRRDEDEYYDDE